MLRVFEYKNIVLYGDKNGVIRGNASFNTVNETIAECSLQELIAGNLDEANNLVQLGMLVLENYEQSSEEEFEKLEERHRAKQEIFEILEKAWDEEKFTQVVVHVINRQGDWLEGLRDAQSKLL